MAFRLPLSAVVITLNEEKNLPRCLKSLHWVPEVIVVDSGSTDGTKTAAANAGARFLEHKWEGYGQQKNWAMSQVTQPWVLFLDADEEVSPELAREIEEFVAAKGLVEGKQFWGAEMPRKTWFLGRWILHGGWYPNRLVRLGHRGHSRWTESTVHEGLEAEGEKYRFRHDLHHYTFRDVGDQVNTNVRYARLGARAARGRGEGGSLAKILLKPVGKFLETYVWKRGFLDGFPGFVISMNAAHSIFMKYVELRLEKNSADR
jgi:glycosyltransferase involved in cell wall biosynthesis